MAITKEQIFQAADELDAAGQNPTLANVRKQVGGGSFTTISEAMNEWRARKTSQATPMREPAPQAVTEKLAELAGDLWGVALDMANNRLAAEREALEAVRQENEVARQEAAELADQLTAELDEAKARIVALEAAELAAKREADALREKLAAAGERAATAEARAAELRTVLDHAHQEARQARVERDQAQERAAVSASHAETLRDLVEGLRADLAVANGQATEIERRADELRADLERANQEVDKERAANAEARKAMAAESHRQAERLTSIQGERDHAKMEAAQAREDAATLRGRVEALEAVLAQTRAAQSAKDGDRKKT